MIKIPVSRRNLFQRINRALAKKGRRLRTHTVRQTGTPGALFVVDTKRRRVISTQQDLEQLAVQLGVLEDFEEVEQIDLDALSDARERRRQR